MVADADIIRRVKAKLADEPVEDLRIDFEDGYLGHDEGEEDAHVRAAAHALAESQQGETAPPFTGIRIKSFEKPTRARGLRTLTLFVAALAESRGSLDAFVVTLPKVTSTEQVAAFVHAASSIEDELGLADKAIRFEIQVETPQSVLGPDGTALVARMVHAAGGRLTALHYGTYDYSAFCGIAAEQQSLEHPVADHAKLVMQAAAAGTGVRLSDGSTNVLPVGDTDDVHAAWTQPPPAGHALAGARLLPGLGPPPRPAAHAVRRDVRLLPHRPASRARPPGRLRRRDGKQHDPGSGTSIVTDGIADEPATARALADYVLRGLDCGAVDADEVRRAAGSATPSSRAGPALTSPLGEEAVGSRMARLGANQYGKAESRVVRIVRDRPQARHEISTSTSAARCAATSPRPTSTATSRRYCRPTPRRTPRSPTPSCTASPRPRTTHWRSAGGCSRPRPRRAGAGACRAVRLEPARATRLRPPRRRGAHLRGDRRARGDPRGLRAPGPGGAEVDGLGVQGLPGRRVHHPGRDRRPDPGHVPGGPLAARLGRPLWATGTRRTTRCATCCCRPSPRRTPGRCRRRST